MSGQKKDLNAHGARLWGAVCILVILAALVRGGLTLDAADTRYLSGSTLDLSGQWELQADGSASYVIPSGMEGELVLSLENRLLSFQVELDGELLYETRPEHSPGVVRSWLVLPPGSAGRTLTLRPTGPAEGFDSIVLEGESYLGSPIACARRLLRSNLYAPLVACVTLLLGLLLFVMVWALRRQFRPSFARGCLYLSLFFASCGLWVLTDSEFLLFYTDRLAMVTLVSFIAFMTMPLALFLFLRIILSQPHPAMDSSIVLLGCAMCVILLGYVFFDLPLNTLLPLYHLVLIAAVLIALACCLRERRSHPSPELDRLLWGSAILLISTTVSLGMFYASLRSAYAVASTLGILLFCLCLADIALHQIYERLQQTLQLQAYQQLAYLDTLTGLGNRTAYHEHCRRWRASSCWTFVMMDLNDLKKANDVFGHAAGDALIQDAARCIQTVFGPFGQCFRIGGDEFLVTLEGVDEAQLLEVLACLREEEAVVNAERAFPLSLAVGYALQTSRTTGPEELFKLADSDMYHNKQLMKQVRPR